MIVISHGILSVWTCRIDEARAEPCARSAAATPSLLNNRHPASPAGGGAHALRQPARARLIPLSPSTRALARRLASGSSESRRAAAEERERWRWGSGSDSCAWPCCPASSAWIQSSGNTWEASSTQKRWAFVPLSLICCLATMTPPHADRSETDLTANPFAGVSLVDCSVRRGANSRFTDQVASHMCTALVSACETHSPLFCPKIPRHLRAYHAWRMFYPHHDSLLYYCCL